MSRFTSIFGRRNRIEQPRARAMHSRAMPIDLSSQTLFHPEVLYLIVTHSRTSRVTRIELPSHSKEAILAILDLLPRDYATPYYVYLSSPRASIRLITRGLRIVGIMIEAGEEVLLGVDAMEELGRFNGPYTAAISRINGRIAEWRSEYSVGLRSMDEQHMRFFEIVNTLFESMVRGSFHEEGGKLLRGLADYARGHFRSEEAIMEKYGYPGLEEHRRHHEQFSRVIDSYLAEYEEGGLHDPDSIVGLLNVARTWLRDHILSVDKEYEEYFRRLGVRVE